MIAVIRIAGQVEKKKEIKETLQRLNLKRKFNCVLIDEKDPVLMGMVNSVASSVAYGEVSEEFAKEIQKKRGEKGKKCIRLHPPIGGLKKSSKVAFPKGILGRHDDISKLIGRML
jgi:ribosomal protein L30/L7E